MITILGIKVSYETLAFFMLFITSEYLGMTKKRKANTVTQAISMAAAYFSKTRTEDDTVRRIRRTFKGK
jgi:DNA-binding NarL/FixJ family response regulator